MGPEEGSSKAIVFTEVGQCYLRNWTAHDLLKEKFDPVGFLSEVALLLDHETFHQILYDLGETEACHNLNHIDGFSGNLIKRRKYCFFCRRRIINPPYTMHLLSYWHKGCLEKFKLMKEYQIMMRMVKETF